MTPQAQDRPVLRWGGSLCVVLAAHAAIVVGALWWTHRTPPALSPLPAEAVMVELAPLPVAPPAPPTELPPGPVQQEQRKIEPRAEPAPKPLLRQKSQPRAEVSLPQQVQQERQTEDSAEANVDETTAPPSVPAPSDTRYAASQTLSGASTQALVTWQSQILGRLEKFKRYPRAAQRLRQQGAAQVLYTVDREGRVLSASLARSSGHESLDAEAVAAVQRASPLPPPPPEVPGDPITVTTPIEFALRGR
ncbi:MAG: energy transducer TonB [Pseudoxanthomonas sp.]